MTKEEINRLDAFFKNRFKMSDIRVAARQQLDDSAEVFIGDEFIGVLSRDDDEEDDDQSWSFNMAILEIDLEPEQ